MKNEFLQRMNDVLDQEGILVLAATNRPWDLDPAVRRRFEKRVYIPLPDATARKLMFALNLGEEINNIPDREIDKLAQNTNGYSAADIAIVCRDALMAPVRYCMNATHFKEIQIEGEDNNFKTVYTPCSPNERGAKQMSLLSLEADQVLVPTITAEDLKKSTDKIKPSVNQDELLKQIKFTEEFGSGFDKKVVTTEDTQSIREDNMEVNEVIDSGVTTRAAKKKKATKGAGDAKKSLAAS